jgi:protoporphyrinogen oxidase
MRWLPSKVGLLHDGRIYNFTTPLDLLRFRPISLIDRLRLGLVTLRLRRFKDWPKLEPYTARDWIIQHVGRRNYEVVWGPLLRGKFGAHHDRVGMVWFWGKIYLRFASRRGGILSRELLGYPLGGFGQVIERLTARIGELGGSIYPCTPVARIVVEEGRAKGVEVGPPSSRVSHGPAAAEPGVYHFDKVIATVPSYIFRKLVPPLPEDYDRRLLEVDYLGAMCVVLELDRPLSHIYWLNIADRSIPFVGAIEQTNFVDHSHYGGVHIVYLSNYLAYGQDLWTCSPDEVLRQYLPHLRKINPQFQESWVQRSHVFRVEAAQPVITANYRQRIPDLRTPIPVLYLGNTTQIYPEDRGTNYSVRLGKQVVAAALQDAATGK